MSIKSLARSLATATTALAVLTGGATIAHAASGTEASQMFTMSSGLSSSPSKNTNTNPSTPSKPAPNNQATYLTDLTVTPSYFYSWKIDKSATINGARYEHSIVDTAGASGEGDDYVTVPLNGKYSTLTAMTGFDSNLAPYSAASYGYIEFYADNAKQPFKRFKYDNHKAAGKISVDVSGIKKLRIVMNGYKGTTHQFVSAYGLALGNPVLR